MSEMDMNVDEEMPTLQQEVGVVTRGRKRAFAQINDVKSGGDQDTGARVCQCCQGEVSATQHNLCSNSHLLCESCLKVAIRTSISTDQTLLTCPVASCQAEITLDESESPFCVTLFRAHVQSILSKAGKPVNGTKETPQKTEVVSCPFCKTTAELTDAMVEIKCSNASCKKVACRFCRAESTPQTLEKHVACALLKFPGSSCWTDLSKLPANWSKYEDDEYKKAGGFIRVMVPLESEEGSSVVKFCNLSSRVIILPPSPLYGSFVQPPSPLYGSFVQPPSPPSPRKVTEVWRIQSPHQWQRYALKKKNMLTELAAEDLHERPLFHGTTQENKLNILAEGFDCRKSKPWGLCGQGTYFSTSVTYSESFCNDQKVFIAYVLCGKSTYNKPKLSYPGGDEHKRMYDSVAKTYLASTMYALFTSSQCYPAYLVTFA